MTLNCGAPFRYPEFVAGVYINDYHPWPDWVDEANREIAKRFPAQIGTYRGHADRDPGHDMSGDKAADFFLFDNSKAEHDRVLAWFKGNAVRLGATYIITWRRIWSVARAGEGVRVYTGDDPHTGHIHVSYGNTPPRQEDDDVTEKEISEAVLNAIISDFKGPGKDERLETAIRLLGSRTDEVETLLKVILSRLPAPPV